MGSRVRKRKVQKRAPLEAAIAALDDGDDAGAIAELIAAWRARKSPVLAGMIATLDARQPARAFADVFQADAGSTLERLQAVTGVVDPRLASTVLAFLREPRFLDDEGLWERVIALIASIADPRFHDVADGIHEMLYLRLAPPVRDRICKRFDHAMRQIAAVRQPNTDEAALESVLASRLLRTRAARDREAELLDEIYRDPIADAPRLVYADALLDRGDPRGELIALQFKRRDHGLDEAEARRERQLLAGNMRQWLGGLAPVVATTEPLSRTTFERGFVAHAGLYDHVAQKLPATLASREWALVEEIHGLVPVILEQAPLRALQRIRGLLRTEALPAFARRPDCFTHLVELYVHFTGEDRAVLAKCEGLPALRELAVHFQRQPTHADLAWLLTTPVAARIARLRIGWGGDAGSRARYDQVVAELGRIAGLVPAIDLVFPGTGWPGSARALVLAGSGYV